MQVVDLLARLERFYGVLPVPPHDPFRYVVWEALSAQTTPGRRDAAYGALHRIPALTPDAMFRAPRGRLVAAVALAGPYQEQRLHALLLAAQQFRRNPHLSDVLRGRLRQARRAAEALPRLGDGSVHRLLLFGGDHHLFPVDRDTWRLLQRLHATVPGTPPHPSASAARRAVERTLPRDADAFRRAALYFRHHALQTCTDDPHCVVCPLSDTCPSTRPRPRET